MTAQPRQLRRRPAKRPAPRTVDVTIDAGDFEGWSATCRVDFSAHVLVDLQSGDVARMLAALDAIIVDHNLPNGDGELAASMADVDPWAGLLAIVDELGEALRRLPPR